MTALNQTTIESAFQNEESLEKTAKQIAESLTKGVYDISYFVEQLGFALTAPSVEVRVNGTRILSATLGQLPKDFLSSSHLQFLSAFYADRLKDQHNVIPAVIEGMKAMSCMQALSAESVSELLHSFFLHTTCQSQNRNDRFKIFLILKTLSERHKQVLKAMGGDFIYGVVQSIDGERDPRNLDFIFSFMPEFISIYPLLHLAEDMFEIFACYFPIDFYPSKNDPEAITRDQLAHKLAKCLVASTEFAEWTISLALEKLASDLTVAKLDSLELLHEAAIRFPAQSMESHFGPIWLALKKEIFPGTDNTTLVATGLKTLRVILEQASLYPTISRNYQTLVMGVIVPHLSEVQQRLFDPSTAIALVCITGDLPFASEIVLNTLLLKLKETKDVNGSATPVLNNEGRLKVYHIIAQIYKIATLKSSLDKLPRAICEDIVSDVLSTLRRQETEYEEKPADDLLDLKAGALSILNECSPLLSESNRALVYRSLIHLTSHQSIDLDITPLLLSLGALCPIELQSHFVDVCIRNFALYSNFTKRKIFKYLLPLIRQMAFTQAVLGLILMHVFPAGINADVRLLALQALNTMLREEEPPFIVELQSTHCLVEKLIYLAKDVDRSTFNTSVFEEISMALSLTVQHLAVSEQYMIVTEHLPQLNLQLESDLYVTKGLLGFLHIDISLDSQFERLLMDLTALSLRGDNEQMRQVAHHLLCSLVNKIEDNPPNRCVIERIITNLKEEIQAGNAKAVEALSWLGKAFTVRGFDEAKEIIEELVALLDHPTLSFVAISAFDVMSREFPQLHLPVVKFLYKQKYFHAVLHKLGDKLPYGCSHMDAFVYVLKGTPQAILKINIDRIAPIIFKCLESSNTHTVCISLEVCENFVKQKDEYFRLHLSHLIPSCLQLARFKESMKVRITALNLLDDITKYPTFVLLPHKVSVILELASALDDHKRCVRSAAVKARNAWYLVGTKAKDDE